MKSKEALANINAYAIQTTRSLYFPVSHIVAYDDFKYIEEQINTIEKDLEILEILKDGVKDLDLDWYFGVNENTEKLKKWLEDDQDDRD